MATENIDEGTSGGSELTVGLGEKFADAEQAAFEKWLHDRCPSGDVESVQRQWLESYEYAELLDEQEPEWQNDVQAAFGGIVQTPQG